MKKIWSFLLAVILLAGCMGVSNAETDPAQSDLGFMRCGILFGDDQKTVSQKEELSLYSEQVDGVAAVWSADAKLFGLSDSSVNYMFNADDELFEVYEYFADKASISKGKEGYSTVQEALEEALGEPLPQNQHVELQTPGFDVDDYVSTIQNRGAKVSVSERDMWVVELDDHVVTVDHVGVSVTGSDLYKHYLFAVAEKRSDKKSQKDTDAFPWPTAENRFTFPGGYQLSNTGVSSHFGVSKACKGSINGVAVSHLILRPDCIEIRLQEPVSEKQALANFDLVKQALRETYPNIPEGNGYSYTLSTMLALCALEPNNKCVAHNLYYDEEMGLSIEHCVLYWGGSYSQQITYRIEDVERWENAIMSTDE